MRKSVFGVCDQLRLNPACSADETSYGLEISAISAPLLLALLFAAFTELLVFGFNFNWAKSRENVSSEIFDQVRFKPACSATEVS